MQTAIIAAAAGLSLAFAVPALAATGWQHAGSGSSQALTGVAAPSASQRWAVGAGGTIVATTDGGAAWAARASGTSATLSGVSPGSASYVWACGAGGAILRSTNGGATWQAQTSGTSRDLAAVAMISPAQGAVAGAGGTILTTQSGGTVDATPPRTTAAGLQTKATQGWRHAKKTIRLSAGDTEAGVAATYYIVDKGTRQTYSTPFTLSAAGSHKVKYWSVDWAGNTESAHTGYVNIDLSKPVCKALGNVKAYTGTTVKFSYRVNDAKPTCGAGKVCISIVKGNKVVQRIHVKRVSLNATHSRTATLQPKLKAGQYHWVLTATDLAGNTQSKKGVAKLTLKAMPLPTMAAVQRRLVALHYLPSGAVTGKSDYRTSQAIMAFQAWTGLSRDGAAGVKTRKRLTTASIPKPRVTSGSGHYVEVYRSLGVVLCVNSGKVVRVVHCSTGRPGLATPAGVWHVYLKSLHFWSAEYSSWMPYASFFYNGDALHGYDEVPAYPASHGCVRLSMPEAAWVYSFTPIGTTVYVY